MLSIKREIYQGIRVLVWARWELACVTVNLRKTANTERTSQVFSKVEEWTLRVNF